MKPLRLQQVVSGLVGGFELGDERGQFFRLGLALARNQRHIAQPKWSRHHNAQSHIHPKSLPRSRAGAGY